MITQDSDQVESPRVTALVEALERLIAAVEACAVYQRGGPAVDWGAVDATQDAAREAVRRVKAGA